MAESEEKLKSLLMKVKEGSTWLKVEPHSSLSQASLINIRTCNSFVPPAPFLNLFIRVRSLVGLKLNIQKTKIMASGPITSWEIDGETVEIVSDFIFWASTSLQMLIAAMKLKDAYSLEGKL